MRIYLLLSLCLPAFAQTTTITGTITDPAGDPSLRSVFRPSRGAIHSGFGLARNRRAHGGEVLGRRIRYRAGAH